jgi:hypothetical protein
MVFALLSATQTAAVWIKFLAGAFAYAAIAATSHAEIGPI